MSPYLIPLPIDCVLSDVEKLLDAGHVTVVRLPLDGGRTGVGEEAVQSVMDQLQELDARATVFLSHLETLVIEVDGERHTFERVVDSDVEFSDCPRTRHSAGCMGRLARGCARRSEALLCESVQVLPYRN